ncbi:MAG: UTP--glucose-1-phosphate uridylyltransferase [Parachlamydiaceae bacterium]|nr:UTP--glucose-1-phosphate uridylyltransferase [Parachlamydiaceae bacterium]
MQERILALEPIVEQLKKTESVVEKLRILDRYLFSNDLPPQTLINKLSPEEQLALKIICLLGQQHQVVGDWDVATKHLDRLKQLLDILVGLEKHYDTIGGVTGYHLTMLRLIAAKEMPAADRLPSNVRYHHPVGINISQTTAEVRHLIRAGLEALSSVAEIYPVGGAGDRLNLHDETTNQALPAAELAFCGRSLLASLVRDLQAREYLYYKLFGKQLMTPIAMMTSHEKDNHHLIEQICESNRWFSRPRETFHLYTQPMVPVLTIQGDWVIQEPLQLVLKPGGHGVIWKLAEDQGVFDAFLAEGREYVLVRQINNPISGCDYGLSAFLGAGVSQQKAFGFASCPRLLKTAEGMDVLVETKTESGVDYKITNIEYTEFEQYGIQDKPEKPGSPYSMFPANTNILFADIRTIQSTLKQCPIPGMLINMKNQVSLVDAEGNSKQIAAGRLESMMQNIADHIVDSHPNVLNPVTTDALRSFVTYNERRKTISTTKKSYVPGESSMETPEGCFYELLQNHEELLTRYCHMNVPPLGPVETYLKRGPSFILLFHPALGPFYQVIAQKIQHGSIGFGSEMQLEIAELEMENLHLDGSLLITAGEVMGHQEEDVIQYSENVGKCVLRNVTVKNKGIDRESTTHYWKNQIVRHEALKITMHGNAEFFASNVTFQGAYDIEVPAGHRMIAEQTSNGPRLRLEEIDGPSWYWKYDFDSDERIVLEKKINFLPPRHRDTE